MTIWISKYSKFSCKKRILVILNISIYRYCTRHSLFVTYSQCSVSIPIRIIAFPTSGKMSRKRKLSNIKERCRICLVDHACMTNLFDEVIQSRLTDLSKCTSINVCLYTTFLTLIICFFYSIIEYFFFLD